MYMLPPLMTPDGGPFAAGFPLARVGSQGNTEPERQPACATGRQSTAAASLCLGQFGKWLHRVPIEKDLMLNLLWVELRVDEAWE